MFVKDEKLEKIIEKLKKDKSYANKLSLEQILIINEYLVEYNKFLKDKKEG